jgi:hypothetical protein
MLDIFNFKSNFRIHLRKNTIYLFVWGTCIFHFPVWFINSTFDGNKYFFAEIML